MRASRETPGQQGAATVSEVAEAAAVTPRSAVWPTVAAGLLALAVAMGIGRFAFTPILPAMRDAFALPPAVLGALASTNYLGYLLGALAGATPVLGRWSDTILRGCLLAVVVTTALMAATSAVPVWLALRFLAGLASAGVFVYGSAVILGWLARRGRLDLTGWFYSGVGVGIAGSGLVVLGSQRLAPHDAPSWRVEWTGAALLAAALTALCWSRLPRDAPAATGMATSAPPSTPAGATPLKRP